MKILLVAGDNKIQWARLQSTSYRGAAAGLHTSPHILPQYNLLLQWCNCNKAGTILSSLQIENYFIIIIKDRSHKKKTSGASLYCRIHQEYHPFNLDIVEAQVGKVRNCQCQWEQVWYTSYSRNNSAQWDTLLLLKQLFLLKMIHLLPKELLSPQSFFSSSISTGDICVIRSSIEGPRSYISQLWLILNVLFTSPHHLSSLLLSFLFSPLLAPDIIHSGREYDASSANISHLSHNTRLPILSFSANVQHCSQYDTESATPMFIKVTWSHKLVVLLLLLVQILPAWAKYLVVRKKQRQIENKPCLTKYGQAQFLRTNLAERRQ